MPGYTLPLDADIDSDYRHEATAQGFVPVGTPQSGKWHYDIRGRRGARKPPHHRDLLPPKPTVAQVLEARRMMDRITAALYGDPLPSPTLAAPPTPPAARAKRPTPPSPALRSTVRPLPPFPPPRHTAPLPSESCIAADHRRAVEHAAARQLQRWQARARDAFRMVWQCGTEGLGMEGGEARVHAHLLLNIDMGRIAVDRKPRPGEVLLVGNRRPTGMDDMPAGLRVTPDLMDAQQCRALIAACLARLGYETATIEAASSDLDAALPPRRPLELTLTALNPNPAPVQSPPHTPVRAAAPLPFATGDAQPARAAA